MYIHLIGFIVGPTFFSSVGETLCQCTGFATYHFRSFVFGFLIRTVVVVMLAIILCWLSMCLTSFFLCSVCVLKRTFINVLSKMTNKRSHLIPYSRYQLFEFHGDRCSQNRLIGVECKRSETTCCAANWCSYFYVGRYCWMQCTFNSIDVVIPSRCYIYIYNINLFHFTLSIVLRA